jgi:hypothetical protein
VAKDDPQAAPILDGARQALTVANDDRSAAS